MKWCVTFDAVARCAKWVMVGVVLALMFGIAGQSDYEDAVLQEMKNCGAYAELSEAHPDWTEGQMIKAYEAERDGVRGN